MTNPTPNADTRRTEDAGSSPPGIFSDPPLLRLREALEAGKIMLVCEECADNYPVGCGHFSADDLRVAPDGRWLCNSCYDENDIGDDGLWWVDAPRIDLDALPTLKSAEADTASDAVTFYRGMSDKAVYSGPHVANILELYLSTQKQDQAGTAGVATSIISRLIDDLHDAGLALNGIASGYHAESQTELSAVMACDAEKVIGLLGPVNEFLRSLSASSPPADEADDIAEQNYRDGLGPDGVK